MIFIIGGRGTGKSLMLQQLADKDQKHLIVYPSPQMLGVNKGKHQRAVTARYLLDCVVKGTELDWFTKPMDYTFYFEEPSMYWNTFLQILALADPRLLKAAAFTPSTEAQSTLKQINPCLVDRVLRMSWEDLPRCQKC